MKTSWNADAIDHSIFLDLLDAIIAAPNKADDLLTLANHRQDASSRFKFQIKRLILISSDKNVLIKHCVELKESIK